MFNINPFSSHPLKRKHVRIVTALVAVLLVLAVILANPHEAGAQESEGKQYWILVPVDAGLAERTGHHQYRFELRTARPTKDDWQFILARIEDFVRLGGELETTVTMRCPQGLCGTVIVRYPGVVQ